jgi:flagellar basal body-associated protein FliL
VEIALPTATPDGRGKRSGKSWLVALLIVLILAAGVAAIVAVRLTAPDAPSAEMDAGELVDRARNRLQQWGLLPR